MGSPSNKAADQANANEAARQAQIASGTTAVNNIFDDPTRTAQYGKLAADTTAYYTQQLDTQKQQQDRQLSFAMARSGQTGGSVATDQAEQSGKDYEQGALNAGRMGAQAGASLQAQDTTERANLIAAVQGGLNATDAASNAAAAEKSNLASANATATGQQLGNAFGDFATLYQNSQTAKANRQGFLNAYNTVYQPGFGAASGTTSSWT
jgi:hypothetical protein